MAEHAAKNACESELSKKWPMDVVPNDWQETVSGDFDPDFTVTGTVHHINKNLQKSLWTFTCVGKYDSQTGIVNAFIESASADPNK
jgi:hypothetical protein